MEPITTVLGKGRSPRTCRVHAPTETGTSPFQIIPGKMDELLCMCGYVVAAHKTPPDHGLDILSWDATNDMEAL